MQLTFKSDTKHRKEWFTGVSFSHPAKMVLPLQLRLIEEYTRPGDVILDPMAGSGTIMVACSMGRNVICAELEKKFCDMMAGNWQKIQQRGPQLGYTMGTCQIINGDARNLEGLLCDVEIFSPPYAETIQGSGADAARKRIAEGKYHGLRPDVWISKGNVAGSTYGDGYSKNPNNIGCLPYGSIDSVITSPPYSGGSEPYQSKALTRIRAEKGRDQTKPSAQTEGYGDNPANIGNLPHGDIDAVITSPPYDEGGGHGGKATKCALEHSQSAMGQGTENLYGKTEGNIGNLKSDSYLQAMLQVYRQCHLVLKSGGLMVLVTKNFIRNKQEVRLDTNTIKLCETAGFTFLERHYRKLTTQSFWRVIYQQKFPDAPILDKEDILIFKREQSELFKEALSPVLNKEAKNAKSIE